MFFELQYFIIHVDASFVMKLNCIVNLYLFTFKFISSVYMV